MKRKLSVVSYVTFLSVIFVITFASLSIGGEFWASKKSNKYHHQTCRWAQKISPYNLIKFSSPEEAIKAGYVPCKVCRPPTSSNQGSVERSDDLIFARRGCCSHHGGVCGCDEATGRIRCCDGTLSPTCTCQGY